VSLLRALGDPALMLGLLVIVLSGTGLAAAQSDPADLPTVELTRQIRAQITPRRSTLIASEMAGRINEITVRDGERFREGQPLVRFNCTLQESQLARARAVHEKKKRIYDVNARLNKLGSISTLELDVNAAEVAEAAAEVRVMQSMVDRCAIIAPFAGRVADAPVRAFQFIGEGQPLLEILDDRELAVEMIVPSQWLAWLKPKHSFEIDIGETGRVYAAEVTRLSGRVDAVSQSIKVYGRIKGNFDDLLAGMSGRALISPPS
jgi:RND family efflux transporter MFP subunit